MSEPFFDVMSIEKCADGSALVTTEMDLETLKKFAAIGIIQTWREAAEKFEEDLLSVEIAMKKKNSKRKVAKKPKNMKKAA